MNDTPPLYGHADNWLNWLGYLKGKPNVSGLELGTFQGASAEWALSNIFTDPTSHYTCVDTFEGSIEHHINGIDCSKNEAITREKLAKFDNVSIFKSYSNIFLKDCQDKFDFIYIDAAHDALNVMRDAVLSFELLKPNGTIIFDDYAWKEMPKEIERPKMAIDAFIACYATEITFLGKGWQAAIRKNG